MSKRWIGIALLAATVAAGAAMPAGARGVAPTMLNGSSQEVVVFESANCIYCQLFRRDVLPQYLRSRRARSAPIRFVDARSADPGKFGLAAPLTMVPTVVVMQNGREQGRIAGYTGPEPFFHMISRIFGAAR